MPSTSRTRSAATRARSCGHRRQLFLGEAPVPVLSGWRRVEFGKEHRRQQPQQVRHTRHVPHVLAPLHETDEWTRDPAQLFRDRVLECE